MVVVGCNMHVVRRPVIFVGQACSDGLALKKNFKDFASARG
jgi:hypothetical protein